MICKSDTSFSKYMLIVVILISTVLGGMFLIDTDSSDAESDISVECGWTTRLTWTQLDITSSDVISDLRNGVKEYYDDDYHYCMRVVGSQYSVNSTLPIDYIDAYGIAVYVKPIATQYTNNIMITSNSTGEEISSKSISISNRYNQYGLGTESAPYKTLKLGWTVTDIANTINEIWVDFNTIGMGQILISGSETITNVYAPAQLGLVVQGKSILCFGGVDKDYTISFDSGGNHYTAIIHCGNRPELTHIMGGECGENLYYSLEYGADIGEYYLTIYGTGTTMNNYSISRPSPWTAYITSNWLGDPYWDILNVFMDFAPNLTNVGDFAFYNCPAPEYIWITPMLNHIGQYSFSEGYFYIMDVRGMRTHWVNWGPEAQEYYIGAHAFENTNKAEFSCPYLGNATYVGDYAFKNSKVEMDIYFSNRNTFDKLEYLGTNVFEDCTKIRSIKFGTGCTITNIPNYMFKGCTSLTNVEIEAPIELIERYSFSGSAITNLTLPDTVKRIVWYAFDGCTSLDIYELPESLVEVGQGAFRNCSSMTTHIRNYYEQNAPNLKIIGAEAFRGCTKLKIDSEVFMHFEVIGAYAFRGVDITSVYLNQNVQSAILQSGGSTGEWGNPFDRLWSITLVGVENPVAYNNIPTSPHYTQYTPWYYNKDTLSSIRFDYSLEKLQSGIFAGMGELKLATILPSPSTVNYVDSEGNLRAPQALNQYGVTIHLTDEWTLTGECGTNLEYTLQVNFNDHIATLDIYGTGTIMTNWTSSTKSPWMAYLSHNSISDYIIEADLSSASNLKSLGDYAFKDCYQSGKVTLPNGLTSIGNHAFANCRIDNVIVPNSITQIKDYAFDGSIYITISTVPSSLEEIGKGAFMGCTSLYFRIYNPSDVPNLKTVGAEAFSGCTYRVDIDEHVFANLNVIGSHAFYGLGLTEVYLNQNVVNQKSDNNSIGWANPFDSSLRIIHIEGVEDTIDYVQSIYTDSPRNCLYTPWSLNKDNLSSIRYEASLSVLQSGIFAEMGVTKLQSLLPSDVQYISDSGATISIASLDHHGVVAHLVGLLIKSGFCGPNMEYWVWSNGLLSIRSHSTTNWDMWDFDNGDNKAPWREYTNVITTVESEYLLDRIGNYAFYDMNITSLSLWEPLKEIGDYAFANCPNLMLTELNPYTSTEYKLTELGAHAFQNCENVRLTDIESYFAPDFIIKEYAFDGSGTSLDGIPSNIASIGAFAFRNTDSYFDEIPESLKIVGEGAFAGCNRITVLSVPTSTTFILGGGLDSLVYVSLVQTPDVAYMNDEDIPWIMFPESLETITIDKITHLPQNVVYHVPYSKIFDSRFIIGWYKDVARTALADTFEGDEAYVLYLVDSTATLDYSNDRTSMSRFDGTLVFNDNLSRNLVGEFIIYPHDYIPPHNIISMVNIMKVIPVMIAISIVLSIVGWLGIQHGRNRGGNDEYYDDSPSSRDPYMG